MPRLDAFRASLNAADRRSLWAMGTVIVVLHLVGFGLLLLYVAPNHLLTTGVGVLAYTFGLRHALDADHIAAVDNTTRKLVTGSRQARPPEESRQPLSVGFWFALGHSTIVFLLALSLAAGVKSLVRPLEDDGSTLHTITGIIGPSVSGSFLWLLGLLNLAALVGIVKVARRLRSGEYDEAQLEHHLHHRGLMNRLLAPLTRTVTKPWHIYPVGVLFGLGFDTATEVGLLVLAGGAAAIQLPFWSIVVLPVLFAAGMCLADTADGVLMNAAYGWASTQPVRKVFYNLIITAISVVVALLIGTIELVGVLADRLSITSGPVAAIAHIPLDYAGYAVVALFVLAWLVAVSVWHFGDVEERWSADLAD